MEDDRRRVHGRDRHRRQDEHRRPRHVPGPDLELPRRHAGHRLHVVLRVPDEVLRRPGLQHPDRRRLGQGQGQLHRGLRQVGRRQRRQGLRRSRSTTTRGPSSTARASSRTRATRSPKTWDDLKALCTKMQTDGLTPIAFGDKDGWPAMGTFDILNLRLNGYDFHVDLMAGKEKWTDPKVTAVFQKWAEILPFHAKDYAGLTWQDAAEHARPEEVRACTCSGCSSRRSSPRRRTRRTSTTSTSSRSRPWARSTTPRARSTRRSTRWQIAAKSPNLAAEHGRRQGLPRVLGQGLDPGRSCSRTSRA